MVCLIRWSHTLKTRQQKCLKSQMFRYFVFNIQMVTVFLCCRKRRQKALGPKFTYTAIGRGLSSQIRGKLTSHGSYKPTIRLPHSGRRAGEKIRQSSQPIFHSLNQFIMELSLANFNLVCFVANSNFLKILSL